MSTFDGSISSTCKYRCSCDDGCCGGDPLVDFGQITEGRRNVDAGEGTSNYLCLNAEMGNVATFTPIPIGVDDAGTEIQDCQGDWCWARAEGLEVVSEGNAFHILTLEPPGETAYDVVSNSENWFACSSATEGTLPNEPIQDPSIKQDANRFYCYQEGEQYAWAECTYAADGTAVNAGTTKQRFVGDGAYALPFAGNTFLDIDQTYGAPLDFTGFKDVYLEFYFRYLTAPISPFDIKLVIYGKNDVAYYDDHVLGYATNPVFPTPEGQWIHVKVPLLDGFVGVESIGISGTGINDIEIKNIFLSGGGDTPICTGQRDDEESSWIEDIDAYTPTSRINGELICQDFYGINAWQTNDNAAQCCGDDNNEYFYLDDANEGCWNSKALTLEDPLTETKESTTMNIEYLVQYPAVEKIVTYPPQTVDFAVTGTCTVVNTEITEDVYVCPEITTCIGYTFNFDCQILENNCVGQQVGDSSETCEMTYKQPLADISYTSGGTSYGPDGLPVEWEEIVHTETCDTLLSESELETETTTFAVSTSVRLVDQLSADEGEWLHLTMGGIEAQMQCPGTVTNLQLTNNAEFTKAVLYDLGTGEKGNSLPSYSHPDNVRVISTTDVVAVTEGEEQDIKQNFYMTCSTDACSYPLPGSNPADPHYLITNYNPELYDLYFVNEEGEHFIGQEAAFDGFGNILVKRVPQQIVFTNEDEEELYQGFYGCQASEGLLEDIPEDLAYENLLYCSIRGGAYCSPSTVTGEGTTLNSWDTTALELVGYADTDTGDQDLADFYESLQLLLREPTADELTMPREHLTNVTPYRNIIPDSKFAQRDLPHWFIEGSYDLAEETLTLTNDQTLTTERIAIPNESMLHFSYDGDCATEITLTDPHGNDIVAEESTAIQTVSATSIQISFTGSCTVYHPVLQLLDEFPAVNYTLAQRDPLNLQDTTARAGAACCPDTYCWNGYACVAPMNTLTYITEHIDDGLDYRCVDGAWSYQPVKLDWNGDQWGFCSQEDQCLVLSSLDPDRSEATAQELFENGYTGGFPTCIGDDEFILDHFCDGGNWTTRTKHVASTLVTIAGDEYALYCTHPLEAFPELADKENQLGVTENLASGDIFGAQGDYVFDAFSDLPEELFEDTPEENMFINNVCILQNDEGTAFATTLNEPLANQFFSMLEIDVSYWTSLCTGTPNEGVVACDLSATGIQGNLWYIPEIEAVIYSKDGVDLTPTFLDNALDWLFGIFSSEPILDSVAFIDEVQNANKLYVAKAGDLEVQAMQEVLSTKQSIVAEFSGFQTPVCEYVNKDTLEFPEEALAELIEQDAGVEYVACSVDGNVQRVEILAAVEEFWKDITGGLRPADSPIS